MITEPDRLVLRELRRQNHPRCVVCSTRDGKGLGLDFHLGREGRIEAFFPCGDLFEGYPAVLHGGVICALMDGAMTNCLFAHGHEAVTAELSVRFRHPVVTGVGAMVRAWITSARRPLYELMAEVLQEERVMATAKGKFVERSATGLFGRRTA